MREKKLKETGWQNPAAMEELAAKIKLARMGVPVRVKEPTVALLTGQSRKKLQADRQAAVGLPFVTISSPSPKQGVRPRGSIFYDLGTVLASLKTGNGEAA